MIKVCDAIMGSGKSSAAINYMNEHPQQRFIYITPYLDECTRICEACPDLNFKEPSNRLPEFEFRKYQHTRELMSQGANIASTHNMFLRYSDDMIDFIKLWKYTLIIDEAVEVLRPVDVKPAELKLLDSAGWFERNGDIITVKPTFDYKNGMFDELVALSKGNRIIDLSTSRGDIGEFGLCYWMFSKEIVAAFENVYILTYMFESQTLKYYFDLVGFKYEKIGIEYSEPNIYHFYPTPNYIPEYTKTLSQKIHVFDNSKINSVGDGEYSLSHTWFANGGKDSERKATLKNNIGNFFRHYNSDKNSGRRLWATFKNGETSLRGKGYFRNNIAFNIKATNTFKDRDVLAYCVNVFMQPYEKIYLTSKGIDVKEDEYALSVMIQWIWRSAIREGKEIWIYIPSRRMRDLLINWIASVEQSYSNQKKGNDSNETTD